MADTLGRKRASRLMPNKRPGHEATAHAPKLTQENRGGGYTANLGIVGNTHQTFLGEVATAGEATWQRQQQAAAGRHWVEAEVKTKRRNKAVTLSFVLMWNLSRLLGTVCKSCPFIAPCWFSKGS